ncbi:efflux RND transporter periplasmic adaptor subunit [Ruegeria sp. SCP11]|uniref:efflux RND transporter periplasmic adaptor subunit n=1 Tax=Ruegeria sp. SCP11 TaxID=3141378 RepID=UPI00333DF27A
MKRLSVGLFAFLLLTACWEKEEETTEAVIRPVRATEISDLSSLHDRYFVGTARAAREVSLAFRVPGNVVGVDVQVGDLVEKGDVVAALDPAPYQAEVDRLTAELASAQATFENAKLQTDRQRSLVEKEVAAQATLDRFVAGETSAQAAINSVQGALDRATLDLTYTSLVAPFDGRVVAKYIEDFEEVAAQTPVLRILDAEHIEVVIDIPERYIALIPHVEDITVTFDALGDVVLPAEISEIGSEASATTRTFPVTLIMQQPEGSLVLPGMAGRVRGKPKEGHEPFDAIMVPASAVFVPEGETDPHVWVFDTGSETVSARKVALGTPRSQGVAVSEGLEFGDVVVTAGANSLREGQKVSLLAEDEE